MSELDTTLSLLAIALLLPGCHGDRCFSGESRCDGDATLSCAMDEGSRDFVALGRGCGGDRCLDRLQNGARAAVCSATGALDPRCPAGASGDRCVDGRTLLRCSGGYGSFERTCEGTCVGSEASGGASGSAFCSLETAPNPACVGGSGRRCDGDVAVECAWGWVTKRTPCAGPAPRCVLAKNALTTSIAYCATENACEGADQTRCNEGTIEGCASGVTVSMTCGTGSACQADTVSRLAVCANACSRVRSSTCVDP